MITTIAAALLSVFSFAFNGSPRAVSPNDEILIHGNKLQMEFDGPAPAVVEVIDSQGRNIAMSAEAQGNSVIVHMQSPDRPRGYLCGPAVIRWQGGEFGFRIGNHHGPCEAHHQH